MTRTQQERTEATTSALLGAARELFAADGYPATSLDAVVEKAGMTKGALYHHFEGKQDLFAAVFAAELERMTEAITATYASKRDSWDAFQAASRTFFECCLEPGLQRIFLLDAPKALGFEKIRELESGLLELMRAAIQRAIDEGRLRRRDPAPLAGLLFGAMCEAAMDVARAPDQAKAQRETLAELRRLLDSLAS